MNLIAQRPKYWTEVVGQPRAIAVLQAILKNTHLMLRGFLFHGYVGVGKTTSAYLTARALMCTGDDPLGCGKCDSCLTIAEHGIDAHPDFKEIDAATNSGVANAREIMELWGTHKPIEGKHRVLMIDEAHRLSNEAWDVFLKPLEQGNFATVIFFVSNRVDSIVDTVRSRCTQIPFELVHPDTLRGLLANVANRNNITYDLDALALIAHYTKGIVRNAVNILGSAGALGHVSVENVKIILDTSLEDICVKLMQAIAMNDTKAAIALADEAGRKARPPKVIETMFSVYGRAVFAKEDPELTKIYVGLPGVSDVTTLFIKWATAGRLPSDILPVIAYEFLRLHGSPEDRKARQRAGKGLGKASIASTKLTDMVRAAPPEGVSVEDIPISKVEAPEQVAEFLSDDPEPVAAPVEEIEDEPTPVAASVEDEYVDEPM